MIEFLVYFLMFFVAGFLLLVLWKVTKPLDDFINDLFKEES